ncbi:TonB-dependent receptor [Croceicoccus mobilis]|uniref:TonB-dependent receptor n=2 Tax=Croceicoccus mobilis TaxID=1703339 RepID=A0A916Z530_9SPHN|nr:TonB-dependent receptor [Croceicoccus mobilis]
MSASALCTAMLPALAMAQSATTQDLPDDSSGQLDDSGIGDIVVYGERRSLGQSAQKVPIAITAMDPALLRSANTVDVTDLGALAPNVQTPTAGTTPGFPNFAIRGIGINSSIRSADPAVNVIQDGMVVAFLAGSLQSTFDLESVEVLRGPQGVLFGRNATGGAISLRTRRPQRDFQVLADVSYGNFNTLTANASVEGALGSDAVMGKLAVLYRRSDGMYKNTNDGIWEPASGNPSGEPITHETGRLGKLDQVTIKPTVLFEIGDKHTLTLFGQYQRNNDDDTSFPRNFSPDKGAAVPLQSVYGFTPTAEGYDTNIDDGGYYRLRAGHIIAELVNEFEGGAKLTTVAAWRRVKLDNSVNFYGGPVPLFYLIDNPERSTQRSVETRLNVPLTDDELDLTAGLFYLNYDMYLQENRRILSAAVPTETFNYIQGAFDQDVKALAAFVNVDWRPTDRLTISLGGRFSKDTKDFNGAPLTLCGGPGLTDCGQTFYRVKKSWTDFSPRAVVNYQATDGVMVYASYTQGYRSGNFNSRVNNSADFSAANFTPADPEDVEAYEVGIKSDLLDRRLRVNVAGFIQDYKDVQQVSTLNIAGSAPIQTLVNAASAEIKGLETEIILQPVRPLRLQANFGYTDAKFKSFNVPVPGVDDPKDLEFSRIPKYTVTFAANVSIPAGVNDIEGRVSYDYRSGFDSDLANSPELRVDGYGLLNANLTYVADNWSLGIWGRNLANVAYAEAKGRAFSYVEWGGQPRTFGVRVTGKFR